MSEGIPFGDLIVFGAIALFIILRYRSILGQKTGVDPTKKPTKPAGPTQAKVVKINPQANDVPEPEAPIADKEADKIEDRALTDAIQSMKSLDASFTLDGFMQGAKSAYEMVIGAYDARDEAMLKMLLAPDIFDGFKQQYAALDKKNEAMKTTLVSIISARLLGARLEKSRALMTVSFVSEQIQYVKNDKGEIVSGDQSLIEQVEDEWTFERDLKSRNPNWTITDI